MKERVILFFLVRSSKERWLAMDALEELRALTETAGGTVIERLIQIRKKPDPRTLIGDGKVKELSNICNELEIDLIIFYNELSPSQIKNIGNTVNCRIIDRTALILDIFARHARTKEAKCQVELAQLQYRLSKLVGSGTELSRLGGGIGTRGPGEKKLEIDRRMIRHRIKNLTKALKVIERSRLVQRKKRKEYFKVVIVGYTNAGKSTLLNRISHRNAKVSNQLFTTLDSTTSSIYIEKELKVIISDTVGFIKDLPHQLIASFQATLSIVNEADLLIHLIDLSKPDWEDKIAIVQSVLNEIGVDNKSTLVVFNKVDIVFEPLEITRAKKVYADALFISASEGFGLDEFKERLKNYAQREVKHAENEKAQDYWPSLHC